MAIIDAKGRSHQYRGGRGEDIHLKITVSVLAKTFGVSKYTVKKWMWDKKLDPTDLLDIIRLFLLRKEKACIEEEKVRE